MNVAIVGAGAAGLVTAYLLDKIHEVTVFEREDIVGGNIRTLGGNVPCPALPSEVRIDAGVVEFDCHHFPLFHALMAELNVETVAVPATTGLFLADGRSFHAPERLKREYPSKLAQLAATPRHLPLIQARRNFMAATADSDHEERPLRSIGSYLQDDVFGTWVRMLLMYAYSTPYEHCDQISATLAVPMLRRFLHDCDWTRVQGGVSTYVDAIVEKLSKPIQTGCAATRVARRDGRVELTTSDGTTNIVDALVFAGTPDCLMPILADASEDETRCFSAWTGQQATTVIHTDLSLYDRRDIHYRSEFDLFETTQGSGGYNAYLNRLSGLDERDAPHYSFAFNLDSEIDAATVIHRQEHHVPVYNAESMHWRDEILETNGRNNIWYVGAWLGNGLHEGAVASASRVSQALGGRGLSAVSQS